MAQFSLVQSLSCVRLFGTPWTAACQASLFITNSQSLLKLMSVESVMPSNYLILCRPLLLSPPIFFCSGSFIGFHTGSDSKVSVYHAGDLGSIPGWGRSTGEGNGNPLQYFCLENPMDRGAWQATVRGVAKSRTRLSGFTFILAQMVKNLPTMQETWFDSQVGKIPWDGNGKSLQNSCLENFMDRGAWQATVRRVAQSRT